MIEFEIYAVGLREGNKIMQLDSHLSTLKDLHYQIDANHEIVYFEMSEPNITLNQVTEAFRRCELTPQFVGQIPEQLDIGARTVKIV